MFSFPLFRRNVEEGSILTSCLCFTFLASSDWKLVHFGHNPFVSWQHREQRTRIYSSRLFMTLRAHSERTIALHAARFTVTNELCLFDTCPEIMVRRIRQFVAKSKTTHKQIKTANSPRGLNWPKMIFDQFLKIACVKDEEDPGTKRTPRTSQQQITIFWKYPHLQH